MLEKGHNVVYGERRDIPIAEIGSVPLTRSYATDLGVTHSTVVSELLVWWDEPEDQDPDNPMNWSSTRKWINIITISVISFLV